VFRNGLNSLGIELGRQPQAPAAAKVFPFRYNARRISRRKLLNRLLAILVVLSVSLGASAQDRKAPAKGASNHNSSIASVLETKIRKSWEDYKKRDKPAFSASLAPDFAEVTNDAEGIFGKDTELSEMDEFALTKFDLKDFKLRHAGRDSALVTYTSEYSGTYAGSPVQMKAVYGEVWVKSGNDWKQLWVQETKIK